MATVPGVSTEWPDGRLNELARRVDNAASKAEVAELKRELRERTESVKRDVGHVARKIDEITGDPIAERRQRNRALVGVAASASAGGIVTLVLYLALGLHGG